MHEATVQRPVTVAKLADVLVTKPYRILSALIRRSIFLAPSDNIDDRVAMEVAAMVGVDLKIIDDEDGGASELGEVPVLPVMPLDLTAASEKTDNSEQGGANRRFGFRGPVRLDIGETPKEFGARCVYSCW